jgi:hypothetical protein
MHVDGAPVWGAAKWTTATVRQIRDWPSFAPAPALPRTTLIAKSIAVVTPSCRASFVGERIDCVGPWVDETGRDHQPLGEDGVLAHRIQGNEGDLSVLDADIADP